VAMATMEFTMIGFPWICSPSEEPEERAAPGLSSRTQLTFVGSETIMTSGRTAPSTDREAPVDRKPL